MATIVLAAALSLLIGVSLGLLGGGGSILTVPIMIYALGIEEKSAIASSLLVVGATSAVAVIAHARAGNVVWRTALIFAGAGMAGAFLGGKVAKFLPSSLLLVLFAVIMFATAFFMWKGRKPSTNTEVKQGPLPLPKILLEGLVVGLVTGLVGAGGGFLVVPALALLGGLPMQKAVGSSLVVIALKSFAGFAGYASHVTVDWQLTGIVTAAAIVGSFGGAALAKKVAQEQLRKGFAIFVLTMAVFLLGKQLQAFVNEPATPEAPAAQHDQTGALTPPTTTPPTTTTLTTTPAPTAATTLAATTPMTTAAGVRPFELAAPDAVAPGQDAERVKRGRALVENTRKLLPEHVGNDLNCKSCHLAAPGHGPGTVKGAAPWVGIVERFPQYRARSGKEDTLEERVNDCFERSMNGKALKDGDPRLGDILAYMTSLGSALPAMPEAKGKVEGQGIRLLKLERAPDEAAGQKVYAARCAACHGAEGQGVVAGDVVAFPPLWGERSFNIAAGMARLHTAAGFIHDHMPLGQGGTLSNDEAWDVAAFVTRKPRPDFLAKATDWPKGGRPEDARY
jgi:cytochrome c/uncharacterized membrane protein YfcA